MKNSARAAKKREWSLRRISRHICYFMSDTESPIPPDYSAVAAASMGASKLGYKLGNDQLTEARRQYDQNMTAVQPIVDAQTGIMRQTAEQGQDYASYMRANQRPVEGQLNAEALGLTSAQRAEYNTMRAQEDTDYSTQNSAYEARIAQDAAAQPTTRTDWEPGAVRGSDTVRPPFVPPEVYNPSVDSHATWFDKTRKNALAKADYDSGASDFNTRYVEDANGTYREARQVSTTTPGTGTAGVGPNPRAVRDSSRSDAFLQNIQGRETDKSLAASAEERGLLTGSNADIQRSRYGAQIEEDAATAGVDQMSGYSRAINIAARQGMRYGYSPEKMAAQAAAEAGGQASQIASATNQARRASTDQARGLVSTGRNLRLQDESIKTAKKMDVAGLYRGLTGASKGAYDTSINAGNSAANNNMAPGQAYMQGMGQGASTMMQGAGARVQGANTIAGMRQQYGDTVAQVDSANAGATNQMIGTGVGVAIAI